MLSIVSREVDEFPVHRRTQTRLPVELDLRARFNPELNKAWFGAINEMTAPNTHFVVLAQAMLFRGAGFAVVWPQLTALLAIGVALFAFSLYCFRQLLR